MSGRKNNLPVYPIVTNGDMSGSITSAITNIQFLDNVGIQLNFSGSPVGNFQIQVSADHQENQVGGNNVIVQGNFIPLTLTYFDGVSTTTATDIPTSLGSPIYLDLALLSAPYIRVVYTPTSGTGTLNAKIVAKMV